MRKGSLGVTFFFRPSVCPSVCPQILGNSFFLVNYNCDASYEHLWCPNGAEVGQKWTGSVHLSVRMSVHPKNFPYLLDKPYARDLQAQGACALQFFLVNYNCDASYDHLWCPNGPEVNRKWTGSDRKWARSGLEVSICPSVRLSIPNTSLTSLTNLMRGIYKRRALAPCDFLLYVFAA